MAININLFFDQYEALVISADKAFERVKADYSDCVNCKIKCADCCYALFDITLIETLYINQCFMKTVDNGRREELIDKANRADRKNYRIKRKAYKASMAGKNDEEILTAMGTERVRCPLLNSQDRCDLYTHRPITCRLYGIPTVIDGASHTCGRSGFLKGKPYPTVDLDTIQRKLYEISADLVTAIRSKHLKMADMLVPVSMALITVYDESYLGIEGMENPDERKRK